MDREKSQLTILVVDDDQGPLLFIEHVLSSANYSVLTANGGDEAMKLINQSMPDLLITDIVMDKGEGTELIIKVRQMSNIPILAISGGNIGYGADYLEMALKAGANASLSKPFYKMELLDKVTELLSLQT